jgi:hypothetical protein
LWESFKSKVTIARKLSIADWLLLGQAWWVLLYFFLTLRWKSLEGIEKSFQLADRKKESLSVSLAFAWRTQKLVYLASRLHLLHMVCLTRACTLHWMLCKRGMPSKLRIGMNRSQAGIHAHAWVELMGQAIGEPEDIGEQFTSLRNN